MSRETGQVEKLRTEVDRGIDRMDRLVAYASFVLLAALFVVVILGILVGVVALSVRILRRTVDGAPAERRP